MRPGLPSALALSLLLALAGAAAGADGPEPLTGLEAGPYARADAVVLAQVTEVTDVSAPGGALGRQVVTARVQVAWKGPAKSGETLALVVLGQRPTLDPGRPSQPYFRRGERTRYVLFLARERGAYAWRLQTLFDADGTDGGAKVAAVAAVATWLAIRDPDARARKTRDDLLGMAGAPDGWTRVHGARELAWLAQVRPDVFDASSRARVARLLPAARSADRRFWLRRTLDLLDARPGGAPQASEGEEDPWRGTFLATGDPDERRALLTRLLAPGNPLYPKQAWWAWLRLEPSLRAWFVEALVATGRREAVADLRRVYAGEEDGETRAAIVRAVGLLGGPDDVAWLGARVANLPLRRAALLALARIRSEDALARLRQVREISDPDTAAWIDHLLSEAFVEAERRARRR